jgi:hypothetical protein
MVSYIQFVPIFIKDIEVEVNRKGMDSNEF